MRTCGVIGRDGIFGNRAQQHGAHGADIESGGFASANQHAAAVSALFGSISGLVRRQVNSLHSAHTAYSTVSGAEPSIPTATPVDNDGVNSSDGSATGQESKDFLLKVRVCSLIDVVGLVYRSALPVILWEEYFSRCVGIGPALQILYVAIKLYDLIAKGKGAAQAVQMLASNTLVSDSKPGIRFGQQRFHIACVFMLPFYDCRSAGANSVDFTQLQCTYITCTNTVNTLFNVLVAVGVWALQHG